MRYAFMSGKDTFVFKDEKGPDKLRVVASPTQVPLIRKYITYEEVEACHLSVTVEDLTNDSNGDPTCSSDHFYDLMTNSKLKYSPMTLDRLTGLEISYGVTEVLQSGRPMSAIDIVDLSEVVIDHPSVRGGLLFFTGSSLSVPLVHFLSVIYDLYRFNNGGELLEYLGLHTPDAIQNWVCKDEVGYKNFRAIAAVRAWHSHPFGSIPKNMLKHLPAACLHRRSRERESSALASGLPSKMALAHALWITTIDFVDYVYKLWDTTVNNTKLEIKFQHEAEEEGFHKFINQSDFQLDNLWREK